MVDTPLQITFSQNLACLAASLAEKIGTCSPLLQKQWILVPHHSLKEWLLVQLARLRPSKGIAACKICTWEEMLRIRFPEIPSRLEMRCLIEEALFSQEWSEECSFFLKASPRNRLELSRHLSDLFFSYGEYGIPTEEGNWQMALFNDLFVKKNLRLPLQLIDELGCEEPLYCFGYSFFAEKVWRFFQKASCQVYLFSPTFHYWEDLCTDKERRALSQIWKKRGASMKALEQVEEYFAQTPFLLANLGKLGRETLKILDRIEYESDDLYHSIPSESVLHHLQREIVTFEKMPADLPPDGSIQVLMTGASPLREVEIVQEEILRQIHERKVSFSEILIFAPDIVPYIPLIEYVFSKNSIPYRFSQSPHQSFFSLGISRLIDLGVGPWDEKKLSALWECPAFVMKGKEISKQWLTEEGIIQWMEKASFLFPSPKMDRISWGEMDEVEEVFQQLTSLQTDLSDLVKKRSMKEWAQTWEALVSKYLYCDMDHEEEVSAWRCFHNSLKTFREARLPPDAVYPLESIADWLQNLAGGSIHGNELSSIRCESLHDGASVPARVVFLLGMDEESFPRKTGDSSLNLLKQGIPLQSDRDRYLVLQILLQTKEVLSISYGHLSEDEGKPMGPSIVVQELLSHLGPSVKHFAPRTQRQKGEIPARFSLRPPLATPKAEEKTISLSDLSLFARHPWKYFLQKNLHISLEDRAERSFAIQKGTLLRSALKWPLETVCSSLHSPLPGLFNEAFLLDVEKEHQRRIKIGERPVRTLRFLETARDKTELPDGTIDVPPLEVTLEGGGSVPTDRRDFFCLGRWDGPFRRR